MYLCPRMIVFSSWQCLLPTYSTPVEVISLPPVELAFHRFRSDGLDKQTVLNMKEKRGSLKRKNKTKKTPATQNTLLCPSWSFVELRIAAASGSKQKCGKQQISGGVLEGKKPTKQNQTKSILVIWTNLGKIHLCSHI